ncbi:MAG: site-specific DNA-methyltransferase [Candidatus Brocadia sp.]|nr:site-specific DNA-methyltransferase [Candidatus Brocadia sp.]
MARKRNTESNSKPIEQYEHKDKQRLNNPPVGLVDARTDNGGQKKKKYQYDPHLDPQLQWAGKAEHTSFEVPTVSLHVHERIDPKRIIETVKMSPAGGGAGGGRQLSLFEGHKKPLRDAIEFYKHKEGWSNRLVAGDSLLVMNSLLEKEGMGGKVQMVYFDPPYGIKYGSNFQPFVNKRDVKDGKDEDLTAEPEMIKAFRDTWELGIHSYLTYLRDRLLLVRELLHESGSVLVQISDENVHHVRELMDEVFGVENFVSLIYFRTTGGFASNAISRVGNFLVWYAKDANKIKYHQLFEEKPEIDNAYRFVELPTKQRRPLKIEEKENLSLLPAGSKIFRYGDLQSQGGAKEDTPFEFEGQIYKPNPGSHWKANYPEGMERLKKANRIGLLGSTLNFIRYVEDYPVNPLNNAWMDTGFAGFVTDKRYVVETNTKVIQRCLLMTTAPGDLVLDITCGSGTTAYVAENWGRRWITCDTSRVAITLAKQRLMTAVFDYYELAHPDEGVGSGFKYKTVPHITLKSIANNEPPAQETLYDQPFIDSKRLRVTGPFTVEAVPAPVAKSVDSEQWLGDSDKLTTHHSSLTTTSIARSGETLRQSNWRDELLRAGVRAKGGKLIEFTRVEPLSGTRYLQAEAETKGDEWTVDSDEKKLTTNHSPLATKKEAKSDEWPVTSGENKKTDHPPLATNHSSLTTKKVVICFGPEHAPLEQRMVELALEEAMHLKPKPQIVLFCAFQFDEEAAKDIDETNWPDVTLLKAQMNADMLTDDLKKKRSSNESFWLIGQPDVKVISGEWLVDSEGRQIILYDNGKKLSGLDSLAEINRIDKKDLCIYAAVSQRRDLWADFTDAQGIRIHCVQHSGGAGEEQHGRIRSVFGHFQGLISRIGDLIAPIKRDEFPGGGRLFDFIERLRGNKQIADLVNQITIHSPLTTKHLTQVEVLGFDYYNPKTGTVESGGKGDIAMWMLDTDYDGRSLFPSQVFFPMAGDKEGWATLAKNLKAEIDEEKIEAFRGTVSLPFTPGKAVAVKIIDARGIESLKIIR